MNTLQQQPPTQGDQLHIRQPGSWYFERMTYGGRYVARSKTGSMIWLDESDILAITRHTQETDNIPLGGISTERMWR